VNRSNLFFNSPSLTIISLNDSIEQINRVVEYWKQNRFETLYKKEHPVIRYDRNDINVLRDSITRLFGVYYIRINKTPDVSPDISFYKEIPERINCSPLSNHEIQFIMSTGIDDAFPRKALTMLIISSHELILSIGGKPVYPKVQSPYLRKKYNLPNLLSLDKSNLFATKMHNDVYSANVSGFVFCRKNK